MKYAIHPDKSLEVFVWRYETLQEAEQEAKRICLEQNTEVEVFEKVGSFKPVAHRVDPTVDGHSEPYYHPVHLDGKQA